MLDRSICRTISCKPSLHVCRWAPAHQSWHKKLVAVDLRSTFPTVFLLKIQAAFNSEAEKLLWSFYQKERFRYFLLMIRQRARVQLQSIPLHTTAEWGPFLLFSFSFVFLFFSFTLLFHFFSFYLLQQSAKCQISNGGIFQISFLLQIMRIENAEFAAGPLQRENFKRKPTELSSHFFTSSVTF